MPYDVARCVKHFDESRLALEEKLMSKSFQSRMHTAKMRCLSASCCSGARWRVCSSIHAGTAYPGAMAVDRLRKILYISASAACPYLHSKIIIIRHEHAYYIVNEHV